jgi:hypothetical protein
MNQSERQDPVVALADVLAVDQSDQEGMGVIEPRVWYM